MKNLLKSKGSIALISMLIISAFTIILVVAMSEINISTSQNYFNSNGDKMAYYTAEACLEEAIIRLEKNTAFTSEILTFDSDTDCTITANSTTVNITANFLNFIQTYQGTIQITTSGQANNVKLLNWKQI